MSQVFLPTLIALSACFTLTVSAQTGANADAKQKQAAKMKPASRGDSKEAARQRRAQLRRSRQLRLLSYDAVQDELKLNAEQRKMLDAGGRRTLRDPAILAKLRAANREERRKLFRDLTAKRTTSYEKVEKTLSKQQKARLREIHLQYIGLSAFRDADVRSALKLSAGQQKQLSELANKNRTAKFELSSNAEANGETRESLLKKLTELDNDAHKNAMKLLSKEQRSQFEKMLGEKFDVGKLRRSSNRRTSR